MKLFQAVLTLVAVVSLNGCDATIGKTIRDYGGYSELRPPMTLVPPGTVVELQQREPATLEIVCSQTASLGDQFKVPESPTYNQALIQAVTKTFDIDVNYLKQIKLDAKYASVKNIKLTVSNATVAQLSADTVYASVVYRKPECQRAIDDYINDKRTISMITSILKADVAYRVEFDDAVQLSAAYQEEILKGVAAQFGAKYQSTGSQRISGDGLYWGIKDDAKLSLIRKDRLLSTTKDPKVLVSLPVQTIEKVFDQKLVIPVITPRSSVIRVQPQPTVK